MTEIKVPRMETIDNTAKIFGLPKHFVRQKVLNGDVVAVTAGSRYLVNVEKFAEYLNTTTVVRQDEPTRQGIQPIPIKL